MLFSLDLSYRTYLDLLHVLRLLLRLLLLPSAMKFFLNLQQRFALSFRDNERDKDNPEEAAYGEPAECRVHPARVRDHLVHLRDNESQQGGDQIS